MMKMKSRKPAGSCKCSEDKKCSYCYDVMIAIATSYKHDVKGKSL